MNTVYNWRPVETTFTILVFPTNSLVRTLQHSDVSQCFSRNEAHCCALPFVPIIEWMETRGCLRRPQKNSMVNYRCTRTFMWNYTSNWCCSREEHLVACIESVKMYLIFTNEPLAAKVEMTRSYWNYFGARTCQRGRSCCRQKFAFKCLTIWNCSR